MRSLLSGRVRIVPKQPTVSLVGSDAEPEKERSLASGDRVRFSSREAFSAIVGNRAVDNGSAINAFPCIEDEKKI
jgi:hypothetical protein